MTRRMSQRTRRVHRRLLVNNTGLVTFRGSHRHNRHRRTSRQRRGTKHPANRQTRLTLPYRRSTNHGRRSRRGTRGASRYRQARRRHRVGNKRVTFPSNTFSRDQPMVARRLRRTLTPARALAPTLHRHSQLLVVRGHHTTVTGAVTI